jgi:hypothetical protein
MADEQSTLPKGFFLKPPHSGAPSWVKGQIGIKVSEAIEYLKANENDRGYVNLDLKESKGQKLYLDLNNYVSRDDAPAPPPSSPETEEDPF